VAFGHIGGRVPPSWAWASPPLGRAFLDRTGAENDEGTAKRPLPLELPHALAPPARRGFGEHHLSVGRNERALVPSPQPTYF
jgi:hypothetical protein